MTKKRLAIITTHPIQYNAPLFKCINEHNKVFESKVFYTWGQSIDKTFDQEFGRAVAWDIPLLEGYDYTFVHNTSSHPGSHHFRGIINPTLIHEVKNWKADAILLFGWSFYSHLKLMRYFHGTIPVLFRGDSTLIDEPRSFSIKKLIRRSFLRWVYRHVDYALFTGTANKQYFIAHGLKKQQLLFAPHAVDNDRFSANDSEYEGKARQWRAELGIANHEAVFLFAAKLIQKKDPELLINAFLALKEVSSWLIIIGNGELESLLKEKYKAYSNIVFIDFQNQSVMPIVYRLGDVFVLPSRGPGETWGLAANEAMACGRGVIVSDKCGCSTDLVVDGKNGYIFEGGNMESLKRALQLSLSNHTALGLHAKSVIKEWNYSRTVQQLENLVKNTIV